MKIATYTENVISLKQLFSLLQEKGTLYNEKTRFETDSIPWPWYRVL